VIKVTDYQKELVKAQRLLKAISAVVNGCDKLGVEYPELRQFIITLVLGSKVAINIDCKETGHQCSIRASEPHFGLMEASQELYEIIKHLDLEVEVGIQDIAEYDPEGGE
jgi:predicted metal-dependent hydrolase